MIKNLIYIIVILLVNTSVFAQNDIRQEIKKIIQYDTDLKYNNQNNFRIAIIDGDTSFVFDFGKIDSNEIQLFEVGSVTKALTASLVQKLSEKSFFKLTDHINDYLPSSYTNPRMEHIRIVDLLEHSSGFKKRPSDFGSKEIQIQNPYSNYSKLDLLRYYRDYLPKKDSYGHYLYSHTNYALLEIIIENATQEKYEDLLNQELFEPFEMKDSYIDFSEYVEDHLVAGYDRSYEQVSPWIFKSFAASNGLKTTMTDLIKYTEENIYSKSLQANHVKRKLSNLNDNIYTARGWHILIGEAKHDIISSSGKSSGHHCMIAFIKETNTGVIVMSNNAEGSKNLAFLVLRMINDNWSRTAINKL